MSSTSTSEMPSTPTWYWMPKKPIQPTSWTNWKPAARRVEGERHEHDRDDERDERGERAPAQRMARSRSPGTKASTTAPTSGAKMSSERMSRSRQDVDPSARQPDEERDHGDEAQRDAQRVVLDAAGLDAPDAVTRAPGSPCAMPLTMPSMTRTSNHMTRVGDGPAEAEEDEVVEVVEPPLVERRACTAKRVSALRLVRRSHGLGLALGGGRSRTARCRCRCRAWRRRPRRG